MSDGRKGEEPWRANDGKPKTGFVEWRDRAFRTGFGSGATLTWGLLGHSDDIAYWRPATPGSMRSMGYV